MHRHRGSVGVRRLGLGALTQAHHGLAQSLNEQQDSLMSPASRPDAPMPGTEQGSEVWPRPGR